jgi:hypothetical protein
MGAPIRGNVLRQLSGTLSRWAERESKLSVLSGG